MTELSDLIDIEIDGSIRRKKEYKYMEIAQQEINDILVDEPESYGHRICGIRGKIKYNLMDIVSGIESEIVYNFKRDYE